MNRKKIYESKKGQLNLSFGWLFAIIVGATILVLTIFGATKIIKTGRSEGTTIGAKELSILFNPLETGFASATSTFIESTVDTRIYDGCSLSGNFGKQKLSISELSFKKWTPPGRETVFENKYIFAKKTTEGRKFYLFSKPFEFPFKISDLIYLTSAKDNYCFSNPPEEIKNEIDQMNQDNLATDCTGENYVEVCFTPSSNCDINVNYNENYVDKAQNRIYFEGDALLYAAVFSDPQIYECQTQRLFKRMQTLASLYLEKNLMMLERGCDSGLKENLGELTNLELKDSSDLIVIGPIIRDIQNKNEDAYCKLW